MPYDRIANDRYPLHRAAELGDLGTVQYYVKKRPQDINLGVSATNYKTPLHYAAARGALDIVKYLIEDCQADMNIKYEYDYTAFLGAAEQGRYSVVDYLIKMKVDIQQHDNMDKTALHLAVEGGSRQCFLVMRRLIQAGVHINQQNFMGKTVLHSLVTYTPQLKAIKYLVENGANISLQNSDGNTTLHLVAKEGKIEFAKYLVEKGADINQTNNQGETAYLIAKNNKREEMAAYLKVWGLEINTAQSIDLPVMTWKSNFFSFLSSTEKNENPPPIYQSTLSPIS